jgi:hypothetical protein
VRNRSKELVELLADVDKIRQERKKAKANRSKYVGTGNDGLSSGGRYGGFGNDSYSGGNYSGDYGTSASGYDQGMISPSSLMRLSLMSGHKNTPVGVAVGSVIPHRGDPNLKSTMPAIMRLRPAA